MYRVEFRHLSWGFSAERANEKRRGKINEKRNQSEIILNPKLESLWRIFWRLGALFHSPFLFGCNVQKYTQFDSQVLFWPFPNNNFDGAVVVVVLLPNWSEDLWFCDVLPVKKPRIVDLRLFSWQLRFSIIWFNQIRCWLPFKKDHDYCLYFVLLFFSEFCVFCVSLNSVVRTVRSDENSIFHIM